MNKVYVQVIRLSRRLISNIQVVRVVRGYVRALAPFLKFEYILVFYFCSVLFSFSNSTVFLKKKFLWIFIVHCRYIYYHLLMFKAIYIFFPRASG